MFSGLNDGLMLFSAMVNVGYGVGKSKDTYKSLGLA